VHQLDNKVLGIIDARCNHEVHCMLSHDLHCTESISL